MTRDPREIAHTVQEKVEKWNQKEALAKSLDGLAVSLTVATGPGSTSAGPDSAANLLLAGWLMADWLLEERNLDGKDAGRPKWCLLCGKRGRNMRDAQDHTSDCGVGMWLRIQAPQMLGVSKLNREGCEL